MGNDGSRSSHEKSRWVVIVFEHRKGEVADDFPLWWPQLMENCSGRVSAAQFPWDGVNQLRL